MSLTFQYGLNYTNLHPPLEWQDLAVDATINDDAFTAEISNREFSFVGNAAEFIVNDWIAQFGVHVGCPFQITVEEAGDTEVIFKGMLLLNKLQYDSKLEPIILKIPIRDLSDNITVFDRAAVISQLVLKQQGFITTSQYAHLAVVQVSKLAAKDRIVAMTNLGYNIVNTFLQMVQDFLSAISDMIGVSVVVGIVEFATLVLNLLIQVQQLIDSIIQHKELLLASQTYYNTISLKDVVEAVFAKLNRTVDWGIIEDDVSKRYLLSSSHGNPGYLFPNVIDPGILQSRDFGYYIAEVMEEIQKLFNTRQHDDGTVVHIKTKSDPYWTDNPGFDAPDLVIETTKQYQNGVYRNKTEEVFGTTRIVYKYDPLDRWTLAENNGDAVEIHTELINEPDPDLNLISGIRDVQVNWAMPTRYDPVDVLTDLLTEVLGSFNSNLVDVQGLFDQFAQYIQPSGNSQQDSADFLSLSGLNFIFSIDDGGLKVEDDTWGVPKIIYAEKVGTTQRIKIPSNFIDKMSAEYHYNTYYLPESPTDANNFEGQYQVVNDLNIPFRLEWYQQIKDNPYFNIGSEQAKFLHGSWFINNRRLNGSIEQKKVYDTNITESKIE